MVTFVPASPVMRAARASGEPASRMVVPPAATMRSPVFSPASWLGESGATLLTSSPSAVFSTITPMPTTLVPSIPLWKSAYSSAVI